MAELNKLTLLEAFAGLREGKFTSRELTQDCFDQIKKLDDKVKAFITLNEDEALAQADAFDAKFKAGESLPPLAGIPVIIKDIFCTAPGLSANDNTPINDTRDTMITLKYV